MSAREQISPQLPPRECSSPTGNHGSSNDLSSETQTVEPPDQHHRLKGLSRKRARELKERNVLHLWSWEMASLMLAIGFGAATISILARFDGQQLPQWPYGINLNTLIALLSVLHRSALIAVVAAIISQSKWVWFSGNRPRPLSHLQYFEDASRGVMGSLQLFFRAPANAFATAGALIQIASLATGPFAQQAIKQVICLQEVPDQEASLPIGQYAPASWNNYLFRARMQQVGNELKASMINGMVHPGGNYAEIIPTCPTGNCTFAEDGATRITHSSIALCSKTYYNYTIPAGLWIAPRGATSDSPVYMNLGGGRISEGQVKGDLSWASSALADSFTALAAHALSNVTILQLTKSTCTEDRNHSGSLQCPRGVFTGRYYSARSDTSNFTMDYMSTTCTFYPYLKNYHAQVIQGVLHETIVSTVPTIADPRAARLTELGLWQSNYTAVKSPCRVDGRLYDLSSNISAVPKTPGRVFESILWQGRNYTVPNECLYKLLWVYGQSIGRFFTSTLFRGPCYSNEMVIDPETTDSLQCASRDGDFEDKWWLSALWNRGNASLSSVAEAMDGLTTAATNEFRRNGVANYWDADMTGNTTTPRASMLVRGSVQQTTICINIDWRWLVLPILLIAASIALLGAMMVHGCRHRSEPVWKADILPFLFYGFTVPGGPAVGDEGNRPAGRLMQSHEIIKRGETIKSCFVNGSEAGFEEVSGALVSRGEWEGTGQLDVDSLYEGAAPDRY